MITKAQHIPLRVTSKIRQLFENAFSMFALDWQTSKSYAFACLLVLITGLMVIAYYLNHPQPEIYPDSVEYLNEAQRIAAYGQIVNAHRVPGFPLLITLVFALAGWGDVMAVSIANALLFILATLEIYIIALLLLRQAWQAFLIGLLVGANLVLLSFVKPILSEALALWLLVSLALVAMLFVYTLRIRYLWMVTAFTLTLFLTRAEWIYVPIPLFAYLVFVAARQGKVRLPLVSHALLSVVVLYAILGGYIVINATQYHFVGVEDIQNASVLGKVIQYDMQNEAPPQYAAVARVTNAFQSHGDINPYDLLRQQPWLASDHYALAGAYAESIIIHHPAEFLAKSGPLLVSTLGDFYYESQVNPQGLFGEPLVVIQLGFHMLYKLNILFLPCAAVWIFLLFWRRTARLPAVQAMGALVLLVLYGLVLTTLGGYGSYIRLHAPFNPLLIVITWGTLLNGFLLLIAPRGSQGIAHEVTLSAKQFAERS